jgi:hypothetical protein
VCRACGLPGWKPHGRDPEAIKRSERRQNARRKALRAMRRQARPAPLSQQRPWEKLGISERTWYRRGLHKAVAGMLPLPTKFRRPVLLTSKHGTRNTEQVNPKWRNSEHERSRTRTKRLIFPSGIILMGETRMALEHTFASGKASATRRRQHGWRRSARRHRQCAAWSQRRRRDPCMLPGEVPTFHCAACIGGCGADVCFAPESGHTAACQGCPLCAISGHKCPASHFL